MFEEQFAGGFVGTFWATGHGCVRGEKKTEFAKRGIRFANFNSLAQSRNRELTHPILI